MIEFTDAKGCNFCNIFQTSWIDKFPEMDVSLGDIRADHVHRVKMAKTSRDDAFNEASFSSVEAFIAQGISSTSAFRIKEHDKWRFDELLTSDKLIAPRTRFLLFFNTKILLWVYSKEHNWTIIFWFCIVLSSLILETFCVGY